MPEWDRSDPMFFGSWGYVKVEGFLKPPGRLPSMAYTSSEKFLRITISDHGRHQPFLDHIP